MGHQHECGLLHDLIMHLARSLAFCQLLSYVDLLPEQDPIHGRYEQACAQWGIEKLWGHSLETFPRTNSGAPIRSDNPGVSKIMTLDTKILAMTL